MELLAWILLVSLDSPLLQQEAVANLESSLHQVLENMQKLVHKLAKSALAHTAKGLGAQVSLGFRNGIVKYGDQLTARQQACFLYFHSSSSFLWDKYELYKPDIWCCWWAIRCSSSIVSKEHPSAGHVKASNFIIHWNPAYCRIVFWASLHLHSWLSTPCWHLQAWICHLKTLLRNWLLTLVRI